LSVRYKLDISEAAGDSNQISSRKPDVSSLFCFLLFPTREKRSILV
jgi:hypothetical protein